MPIINNSIFVNKPKTLSYLLSIILSFIVMVLALDIFWSYVTENNHTNEKWQIALFEQLDHQLASLPEGERLQQQAILIERLQRKLGSHIRIENLNDIQLDQQSPSAETEISPEIQYLDIKGERFLTTELQLSQKHLVIGPIAEQSSLSTNWITVFFYLCIALFVWLWLRPLLSDLDKLKLATRQFAENYQRELPDLQLNKPVQELADSFKSMSEQIRTLIYTQAELTGGLSHELRTPLARIKFALATAKSRLDNQASEQLDSIEQDVQELEQLVEAMLGYSRLEQTRSATGWSNFDAETAFSELAGKYRWRTEARIDVIGYQKAKFLDCDARLMSLAVSNLVSNACRYATTSIQIHYGLDEGDQFVIVEDDGAGIPSEKINQAIEPFRRIDNEDKAEGFGLGLAIVRRIALLHGGKLSLEHSQLGGLRARIIWPMSENLT